MAWRPYQNLIEGELDNTILGKVTGWILFFRKDEDPLQVNFYLHGDFHEDIRGKKIRITNTNPKDKNEELERDGSYMESFSEIQTGGVGDITAGLPVDGNPPYVSYPYIEWYSQENGRVVLELDSEQIEITGDISPFIAPLKEYEKQEQHEEIHERLVDFLMSFGKEYANND